MSNDIKIQFTISMILYHFISAFAKLPIAGTDLQIVRKIENLYRMVVLDNVGCVFYCLQDKCKIRHIFLRSVIFQFTTFAKMQYALVRMCHTP